MTRDEEVIIMECEEIMAERREHREWVQGLLAEVEAIGAIKARGIDTSKVKLASIHSMKPAPVAKAVRGAMPEGWAPTVGRPVCISDKPDWMVS